MKKYNQVKVINEENEEELNEDQKEESNQNEFFIKDQIPNERRKIIRSEKLKMENERNKTLINFNKLFEAIGWNKDDNNNNLNNKSFILENKSSSSAEENDINSENELELHKLPSQIEGIEKSIIKTQKGLEEADINIEDLILLMAEILGEKKE